MRPTIRLAILLLSIAGVCSANAAGLPPTAPSWHNELIFQMNNVADKDVQSNVIVKRDPETRAIEYSTHRYKFNSDNLARKMRAMLAEHESEAVYVNISPGKRGNVVMQFYEDGTTHNYSLKHKDGHYELLVMERQGTPEFYGMSVYSNGYNGDFTDGSSAKAEKRRTESEKARQAREKTREKARQAREKSLEKTRAAREKARQAREKSLEKNRLAREKAREKAQESREKARQARERAYQLRREREKESREARAAAGYSAGNFSRGEAVSIVRADFNDADLKASRARLKAAADARAKALAK